MKTFWILRGLKFAVLMLLFAAVATYIVMTLWNWIIPPIFGWTTIQFWQALGLLVLSKILFGFGGHGWHRGGHWGHGYYRGHYWKDKMEERLKTMTPEEREKFRAEWKSRCGRWGGWSESKMEQPDEKSQTL